MQPEEVQSIKTGVPKSTCNTSHCNLTSSHPTQVAPELATRTLTSAKIDLVRAEKRRKSNRHSARRWRNRKRSKLSGLHDQICALQNQHKQLEQENYELKKELAMELESAKADSTVLPHKPQRLSQEQAQSISSWLPQNAQVHLKSDWTTEKYSNLAFTQAFAYPSLWRMACNGSYPCNQVGTMMQVPLTRSTVPACSSVRPSRYIVSDILKAALLNNTSAESYEVPYSYGRA